MKKAAALAAILVGLAALWVAVSDTTPALALQHRLQSGAKRFSAVTTIRVEGVDPVPMFLHPQDELMTPWLWSRGSWEDTETRWFVRSVRPGDVVVDVGANIGYYTLLAGKLVGESGRVYAFEPAPKNFAILERNVRLNGLHNVVLEQKAVSDQPGTLELFLADENKGDHRIYEPEGETREAVVVEAVPLDLYFEGREDGVDFIKVDTQGAELVILRGMRRLVRRSPDLVMAFEYSPRHLAGFGATGEELLAELRGLGLDMFDLGMGGVGTRPVRRVSAQQLRRRFSPRNIFFTNLLLVKGRPDLLERIEARKQP